jgi:ABC-type transporter Mla subunit MlaD
MNAWQTMLKDAGDQKYWLVAGVTTGTVGTAIAKADKWAEVARARTEQAQIWRSVADKLKDPYDISRTAAQAGVYEKDAAKFEQLVKSDRTLTAGLSGTKIGDLLKANLNDVTGVAGKLGSVAEKVPVVGGLLAAGQTVYDVMHDNNKSAGAIAQHVGADMGGFVAGTAATEGAMALAATIGVAGGPVTLAAVGIGVGVAYGVGEVVNHWPEISHWAGDTAGDIGHGVENATKAVGNFFSSVF